MDHKQHLTKINFRTFRRNRRTRWWKGTILMGCVIHRMAIAKTMRIWWALSSMLPLRHCSATMTVARGTSTWCTISWQLTTVRHIRPYNPLQHHNHYSYSYQFYQHKQYKSIYIMFQCVLVACCAYRELTRIKRAAYLYLLLHSIIFALHSWTVVLTFLEDSYQVPWGTSELSFCYVLRHKP